MEQENNETGTTIELGKQKRRVMPKLTMFATSMEQ